MLDFITQHTGSCTVILFFIIIIVQALRHELLIIPLQTELYIKQSDLDCANRIIKDKNLHIKALDDRCKNISNNSIIAINNLHDEIHMLEKQLLNLRTGGILN